ncbi:hypothetical protein OG723_12265 [Streptomyces sp. NBC_01278]|uniref:hypothetical protein n=1 Tax=Streptomyces sp. NBC_01278 TaxID=2903809 RepID=UPI002E364D36|nr:hypothetical protein [Streptomyces sp. NBC_01278]
MDEILISEWTGRTATLLQSALRMSRDTFAHHLGVHPQTVAGWHSKPDTVPRAEMQAMLDTAYEKAPDGAKRRFAANFPELSPPAAPAPSEEVALLRARIEQLEQLLTLRVDGS